MLSTFRPGGSLPGMADSGGSGTARRRRRADAQRSIEAIVGAGRVLFSQRPDASMEDVAAAAGLSRQTVYAHFTSREALLHAVLDDAAAETLAAIDDLDACPPADALTRFLDAGWQLGRQYFSLLLDPALTQAVRQDGHDPHEAFLARLESLISRGQRTGCFDRRLHPAWLATAIVGMWHAAGEQIRAGRMTADEAAEALRESALRICGIQTSAPRRAPPRQDASERPPVT